MGMNEEFQRQVTENVQVSTAVLCVLTTTLVNKQKSPGKGEKKRKVGNEENTDEI